MLNNVRYGGLAYRFPSTVWLQPLAAPTIIVACGPRRISAAMSTTYDTDIVEPLATSSWTLKPDVMDDKSTMKNSGKTGTSSARGTNNANTRAPAAMTATMNQRARGGRSLSKSTSV